MITCKFEDGNQVNLRHVTADVIVLDTGRTQVLLTKRAKHMSREPGKWALPGGFIDRDELIVDGARREVLEETGYTLASIELSHINDKPAQQNDDRQNVTFYYKAVADKRIQEPDDESERVEWFDLDKLPAEEQFAFNHLQAIRDHVK